MTIRGKLLQINSLITEM